MRAMFRGVTSPVSSSVSEHSEGSARSVLVASPAEADVQYEAADRPFVDQWVKVISIHMACTRLKFKSVPLQS